MAKTRIDYLERLAFQHAPDATLLLRDRVIKLANRRVEDVFGWAPYDLVGKPIRILYPGPTDYRVIGERARKAMQEEPIYRDERFMRRKDKQIVWMEGHGTTLDSADPEKLAIWSYRPIEHDRQLKSALTPTEKRVAHYLVNGFTSKEIALALGCSPRTIEVHRANMIRKMGARNSLELIRRLLAVSENGAYQRS